MQVQRHGFESVDHLANRLAQRYHWTDEEREQNRSRIYDIRTAFDHAALAERMRAPLTRNPAALDDYFKTIEERAEAANAEDLFKPPFAQHRSWWKRLVAVRHMLPVGPPESRLIP